MFDLIASLIGHGGLWGVFLLMTAENVIPAIPSEVIMPMAGYVAASGRMSWLATVLVGTAGSTLGAIPWYLAGRWVGLQRLAGFAARYGRWLTLSPGEIERADRWFKRFGPAAVLVGRSLPGVRGVICIPAGLADMPLVGFLVYCSLGSLAWCALLTTAGFALRRNYALVSQWTGPATTGFLVVCLAIYGYRFVTFRRR